ncbi:MAG: ComEC/Rec2 family competence protein, partial [Candidatus Omnitrophica bacterium]|nr:ComEC/Rec2 family competence protein [Candidatus Omnitrophota bacterium]
MKRPLLGITVAFFTGILLEETLSIPVFYLFLAALITAFLSVLFLQSRLKFSACILIAFLFTGGLCLKNYNTSPAGDIKNLVLFQQGMPSQVILKGVIANRPYSRKTHNLQDKTDFLLDVKALMTSDAWRQSSGTVLANVFNPAVTLRYGDEVILEGELSRPRAATNPGQFDYKKFLEREKIFYCLTVKKENFYKIIGYKGGPLKRFVYAIKARIEALIAEFSPQMEGAFLNTVLLGNRQDMDDDVNDDFVKTGTVHILSISGLHVALMAAILMLALKILRLPFGARAVLLAGMVAMYCVMVDSKPPVMRSAIMIIIFLAGRLLKREQDMLSTLSFSALAILLFDPNDIFNIGFQLSFLTVGAIVYVAPHLKHDPGNKIRSYFFQTTAVSFAAWLASAPLVARYFNIVSPVTVLANIFVVPWVFFVMAVSFVFIIFGSVSHALALVFSQVTNLSITVLIKMVSVFSQIPLACFRVKSPPWVFVIGFYLFVFLFLNRARLKLKAKYFLIGALLLSNIFIWHRALLKPPSELKITFLDVGKGDSMFLEFPGGGTMLIDGGEGLAPDMGRLVVNRFLSYNGINCIDAVCATHPHTDHIGGIVNVLR